MPGASATYAPPRSRRVRWDRLGRIAMLLVLMALVYLYLSAGLHMLSSWKQSRRDNGTVATMEREHRTLLGERNTLSSQSDLEIQATQLDMIRPGERPYVVGSLPHN